MSNKDLIPPDPKRCQAMVPNGYSFMTLGGIPGHVRCKNKPLCIVSEKKKAKDGLKGSMSLCKECLVVAIKQLGANYFEVKEL